MSIRKKIYKIGKGSEKSAEILGILVTILSSIGFLAKTFNSITKKTKK